MMMGASNYKRPLTEVNLQSESIGLTSNVGEDYGVARLQSGGNRSSFDNQIKGTKDLVYTKLVKRWSFF